MSGKYNSHNLAEVWDQRQSFDRRYKDYEGKRTQLAGYATIGVNWPAYGPVCPSMARKLAASLLSSAKEVERRTKRLRAKGWVVKHTAR